MERCGVRWATPADERAIESLAAGAARTVVQIPWRDLSQALRAQAGHGAVTQDSTCRAGEPYDIYLGEGNRQLGFVFGLSLEAEEAAFIRVFALRDDWVVSDTLAAVLPSVRRALCERKVALLAYLGAEDWLLDGLLANGFHQANTILTLHKSDFTVPDAGDQRTIVRPAAQADFADILIIDRAAFDPLWRNTLCTLVRYQEQCPYFVVAELDGRVVGYEYASLTGRHGHLTRIAVHPRHHGQRIGTRLLCELLAFFRRRQVLGVTLNTQQDNARARRFYEWFGFRTLGKEANVLVCSL